MSGKKRLSIFLSILWLILAAVIGVAGDEFFGVTLTLGVLPLILVWGVWWVANGFLDQTDQDYKMSGKDGPSEPLLLRLWRGDVPLATTFWVWGFAVFSLLRIADAWAERNIFVVQDHIHWYWFFSGIAIIYGVFIWVAIWRSAENSQSKVGAGLARLWVGLGILQTVVAYGTVINDLNKDAYSESDLRKLAFDLRKSLPAAVDDITVLDSVSASGRTLTYKYTVDIQGQLLDLDILKANILANSCTDDSILSMINDDVVVDFEYQSEIKDQLGTITITKESCQQKPKAS